MDRSVLRFSLGWLFVVTAAIAIALAISLSPYIRAGWSYFMFVDQDGHRVWSVGTHPND